MHPFVRVCLLWLLPALFLCRVVGQICVGIYTPDFLPEWKEWYSGLLPYPLLLPTQLIILMVMAVASTDASRCSGVLFVESPRKRSIIRWLALVYALVMVVRYIVRMVMVPEARWFGGTIPIWFHFVLAGYLVVLTLGTSGRSEEGNRDT